MPDFKLPLAEPGRNDTETLQNLLDTMLKYRKELNFLLQNLDADNVLEAKSVIADWIYAGQVTTDQLIAGEAKISTALIEELIVGGNVSMGPDAVITWGNLPYDVASYDDVPSDAYITQITKDTITTSYLRTIFTETDISQVNDTLNVGSIDEPGTIFLYGSGGYNEASISYSTLTDSMVIFSYDNLYLRAATGQIKINSPLVFGELAGSVDFNGVNVTGLNVTAKFL